MPPSPPLMRSSGPSPPTDRARARARAPRGSGHTTIVGVPRLYETLVTRLHGRLAARGRLSAVLVGAALRASEWLRRGLGFASRRSLFAPLRARFAPAYGSSPPAAPGSIPARVDSKGSAGCGNGLRSHGDLADPDVSQRQPPSSRP